MWQLEARHLFTSGSSPLLWSPIRKFRLVPARRADGLGPISAGLAMAYPTQVGYTQALAAPVEPRAE